MSKKLPLVPHTPEPAYSNDLFAPGQFTDLNEDPTLPAGSFEPALAGVIFSDDIQIKITLPKGVFEQIAVTARQCKMDPEQYLSKLLCQNFKNRSA